MAMSLNKAQLIGNLTRDPEMKQIPGGQVVATIGIATNFTWNDKSGQKQSKTEFHNIVVWGKLAEICGQYLKKGSKVYMEGRLQTRNWEGEDGVKRYRTEIIADNMIMLDSRGAAMPTEGAGAERESAGLEAPVKEASAAPVAATSSDEDVSIDDLPF